MRKWFQKALSARNFTQLIPKEASQQPTPLELEKALNKLRRAEKFEHNVSDMTEIITKKINNELFDDKLLPKQRVIIEPVRMRHPLDSFDHLRTTDHLPATIFARGDQPGVDFVLHKSQARALRHLKWSHSRPIHVKLPDGEEVRCQLQKIFVSPDSHHYLKVTFDRYVVGEPNIITVKLVIGRGIHMAERTARPELLYEEFQLISYNDINPIELEIDFNRLSRKKRYTLGDLANTLPPGLAPHPKYKTLDFTIAKMMYAPTRIESDMEHLMESVEGVIHQKKTTEAEVGSLTSIESEDQWERTRALATEKRREDRRIKLEEAKRAHPKRFKEFVPFKKRVEADAAAFRKKLEEETKNEEEEHSKKQQEKESAQLKTNKRLLKDDN